jgi:hypothetical protein
MAYRDIKLSKVQKSNKENLTPVFSDLIGEMEGQGKIDNFIDDSIANLNMSSNISSDPFEVKFNSELTKLISSYKNDATANERWLTIMGLIERKILQLRCYKNPTLAFSLQEQKSGENTFSYIVIRALFIDLYSGKKEIRRYFNKLEDYPKFNNLDDLKTDKSFLNDALIEIKSVMAEQINHEGITLDYLESELEKLKNFTPITNISNSIDENAKKKAGAGVDEINRSKEERKSRYSQEQKYEIEKHKKELISLNEIVNDDYFKNILLKKEDQRHKEEMKRLKSKKNITL